MQALPFEGDAFDLRIGLTNAILSDNETRQVQGRYHARRNRVLQIDEVLVRAPRPGSRVLFQEREQMVRAMQRYRVALSPHKKLPVEILQEIFLYASAGYNRYTPRVQDPPILLCLVCSSWRQTAFNMPELWNNLHFSANDALSRLSKLTLAQMWFSRAADMPLSLTLLDTPEDHSPNVDFINDLIAPFSTRFKYLHVVLHPSQIDALLSLGTGSFDRAEECRIVSNSAFMTTPLIMPWESPVAIFSQAARLRRLRIHLGPLLLPDFFRFPWYQLQVLRCDSSMDASHCTTMLRACNSLQKVHVRIFGIKYSPPPAMEISLPNLTSFSVQLCDQENYDRFFFPMVLPQLKSLWIYSYDGVPWSPEMYNILCDRSRCSLEHISLASVDILETRDLLRLFQLTPNLISVTISHNTPLDINVLNRIGRGEIGASLAQLFLKGQRNLDHLLVMLETRQRLRASNHALSSLKFIETYVDPDEIPLHADRLQSLRDGGCEISLLHSVEGHHFNI